MSSDPVEKKWPYQMMRFNWGWLIGLLLTPLAIVTLLRLCNLFESEDVLTIAFIFAFILLVVVSLEAWKAYLGHLSLESDRIEARQSKLESEEQKRRDTITSQEELRKEAAKQHEDKIKEIFTNLFNAKIEELKGHVAEKITRDELLRLANELKSTTIEYYDSDRKQTKVTTQSVPEDVRKMILKAYPDTSHFKPEEKSPDGN